VSAASTLLAEIHAAGAEVGLDCGMLRIRIARGVLAGAQRRQLIEHRAAVATLLTRPANNWNALQGYAADARLPDWLDYLILYGQEWRGAVSASLVVLMLKRPRESGP
jgi:hypothetical protein